MGFADRLVSHLFITARNRDGQASAIEQLVPSADAVPVAAPAAIGLLAAATAHPARHRPGREDALRDVLAQKVLHGWTQNRNQTLHPLTLNFATLDGAQAGLLLEMVAMALSAGGAVDPAKLRRATAAIEMAHGRPDLGERLPGILAAQRPPQQVFDALLAGNLAGYAYAVTMAAIDQRDPTNRSFAAYAAARLAIPEAVSRSIGRRYRS